MINRKFGKTGWEISVIGQGLWNIGNQWGEMDDATAEKIILKAYDSGINLFDVAEAYGIPHGLSEIRLGSALKKMKRESVYIVSKIGNWGKRVKADIPKNHTDYIRLCGHAIAGRLRTDYVDIMLCHDGMIQEPEIYIEGFELLRQEGFIRHYGISTDNIDVLRKFYECSKGACAVLEVDYSLINLSAEKEILPFCMEHQIGVLVRGPLAKGVLSGKFNSETVFKDPVRSSWNRGGKQRAQYESQLAAVEAVKPFVSGDLTTTALQYVISHPSNPVVIPGATNPSQVEGNAKAGDRILSQNEMENLKKAGSLVLKER